MNSPKVNTAREILKSNLDFVVLAKKHWLAITVVFITAVIAFGGEWMSRYCQYDRIALERGEIWRLITGNFTHLNVSHWLLNTMGWVLVWWLFRPLFSNRFWVALLLWSSFVVSLGLYLFNTQLFYYVGLSGTLHGLFIAGAMMEIRRGWRLGGFILFFGFSSKLVYEQIVGSLPGTTQMSGGAVIVDAHLYGAIAGLVLGSLWIILEMRKTK